VIEGSGSGSATLILTDLTEGEDGAAAKCLHEEHGGDVGGHLGGGHGRQAPEEVLKITKGSNQRVLCVRARLSRMIWLLDRVPSLPSSSFSKLNQRHTGILRKRVSGRSQEREGKVDGQGAESYDRKKDLIQYSLCLRKI
jgi:hypothetical protein